jgi:uncharacterized protein (TIGR02145 family)
MAVMILITGNAIAQKKKTVRNDDAGKSVTIGTQIWTAQNMNVDKFRNGDQITEAKTTAEWLSAVKEKKPAWCYLSNDAGNGEKYGRLYNWFAVIDPRGLAPKGWHVPTDDEWKALMEQLGGDDEAAGKMKSTSGWSDNGKGTNESGFNALPGSSRAYYGTFYEVGIFGYWWSATPTVSGGGYGYWVDNSSVLGQSIFDKEGLSVRCVKD